MSCSCHHHKGKVRFPVFLSLILFLGLFCVAVDLFGLVPVTVRTNGEPRYAVFNVPAARLELVSPAWDPVPVGPLLERPWFQDLLDYATLSRGLVCAPAHKAYIRFSHSQVLFTVISGPRLLYIHNGEHKIKIDLDSGKVSWPETLSLDEAAIAFWRAVETTFPLRRPEQAAAPVTQPDRP